ncbi:protein phosphatase regulator [Elasticomyces elasticus]|uniref:Protein phosphatase regulator n=1 Tax=Exophiala sideris TaxID=1016849 RepID=A0ABR0JIM6_9EURO|nr:protein phosphatase regulator [Elasticomyces elasticus]KAK5034232.1 protein phosphatase regulator [Exophiala sideris]KAK5042528.1 protein phosphatase regulator [Exophiala sideris]KAK5065610.1 protein phosphatase regulator [Exophiala sideris]KAK5185931.1 protein phosphatase regulator [Eurotiomycetes sp. CCFEE 6388]
MPPDTLDLQAHEAPSAKDHTRQPAHPQPYGFGAAAPHQAQTIRQAEEQAYQQQHTSPKISEDRPNGGHSSEHHFYDDADDDRDDDHMDPQNGINGNGYHGQDLDDGEGGDSHDEDMDDDLMDKISSSPSIEDGKYPLSVWPRQRADVVDLEASPASLSTPTRGICHSSSPFASTPEHFPLRPSQSFSPASHHGEYMEHHEYAATEGISDHTMRYNSQTYSQESSSPDSEEDTAARSHNMALSESQEFRRYLLPVEDPLLANAVESYEDDFYSDDDENDCIDEGSFLPDADSNSDDDTDEFQFCCNDRFIDSGWGGECLREIEDIDFEFVYALHTFVATVEGQANATKGDTMVLLDDSNSYWWLVRVVKDGSIGYLPAEHIETPTERLARLNKHRNVDLSASMLGDNTEKSKNPLKKAMRRRNAKTVQFSAPTYYEPSEYEYSDEEEEDGDETLDQIGGENNEDGEATEGQQDGPVTSTETQSQAEPTLVNGVERATGNEGLRSDLSSSPPKAQQMQNPQDQTLSDEHLQRSRKGVVRNTDSFFRDDTVETKKISLTPRLLRGDSEANVTAEQGVRERASLETFDKVMVADDKAKEKKKEKKGMLSGLFKRKKGAAQEENEKVTDDPRQTPQNKDSLESLSSRPELGPERKPSKLQKAPPVQSPVTSPTDTRAPSRDGPKAIQSEAPPAPTAPAPAPPTVRKVESDTTQAEDSQGSAPVQTQPAPPVNRFPSLTEKRSIFAPITTALKSNSSSAPETASPVKPIYSKRAKERFAIDDSGSDEGEEQTMHSEDVARNSVSPLMESQAQKASIEIAREVSPLEATTSAVDIKVQGDHQGSPFYQSVTRVSPEPHEGNPPESEGTASTSKPSPSTATHTPSTSRSTPTWSDASLRTYMENNQDIKDLLIIVHDNSNVTPVGPEHPLMHNLFSDERTKLVEMQSRLDDMLMNWISKKHANLLSGTT